MNDYKILRKKKSYEINWIHNKIVVQKSLANTRFLFLFLFFVVVLAGTYVYWSTGGGIFVCCICTKGDFPPHNGWGCHCSFRFTIWPSFCFGVYNQLQPHVCCHCRGHRHKSCMLLFL